MLTRTGGYALHAVVAIAARDGEGRLVPASEIAEELDIPANYLAKILHALARAGILRSERGRTGGFGLTRAPADIRLIDVVDPFENLGPDRQCLLGRGTCSDVGGCPAHKEWREASAPAFRFFETRTVADLVRARGHDQKSIRRKRRSANA